MSSPYELNFGMSYAVTTASIYLEVLRAEVRAREYVVCVRAMQDDREVELGSPGWHHSHQLQTQFCYLPAHNEPGIVRLPPLAIGGEVTKLHVEPRVWGRGAMPTERAVASVWIACAEPNGGSTIFRAELGASSEAETTNQGTENV